MDALDWTSPELLMLGALSVGAMSTFVSNRPAVAIAGFFARLSRVLKELGERHHRP